MTDIREKQLRDRVTAARAIVRVSREEGIGVPSGEVEWAQLYAEDVGSLRRHLTAMVIADVARSLTSRVQNFPPLTEARARAQKFLGGRPR